MELTESSIMHNAEAAVATLRQLTALGVQLSVDDFGTGYSSLSYLKNLPIDTAQDRPVVRARHRRRDDRHRVLARTIISMGHSLDLKVVAEGVERRRRSTISAPPLRRGAGILFQQARAPEEFHRLRGAAKRRRSAPSAQI